MVKKDQDQDQPAFTSDEVTDEQEFPQDEDNGRSIINRITHLPGDIVGDVARRTVKLATKTAGASLRVGRAMLKPERLEMMREAGLYLRDVRELAGLTLTELSEALDLEDKSLLEAVEAGTTTLSFELILRLAALVARHDPIPFVMRLTRIYNPTIWRILDNWGVGRLTLQVEREREFINIFRKHDVARKLSDAGFTHILEFTESAFEMALHYVAEREGLSEVEDTG